MTRRYSSTVWVYPCRDQPPDQARRHPHHAGGGFL